MELEAIVGGYGIVRIHPEEFERKRGFVDSCYVIFYEEEVNEALEDGEWELNEKYNCLSTIHKDPIAVNNPETDAAKEQVKTALLRIDERITIHDFRLVRGQTHTNLVFDISAPYDIQLSDGKLKARAVAEITAIDETFNPVITIDRR